VTDYVWNAGARPDVAWNNAYRSLFTSAGWQPEAATALLLILGTLAVLTWRAGRGQTLWRGRVDFALVLLVIGTLPLYLLYMRSTYVFVAVFGYVAAWLAAPTSAVAIGQDPRDEDAAVLAMNEVVQRRARGKVSAPVLAQGLCALLVAAALAYILVDARERLQDGHGWLDAGISTLNPIDEAEFLARSDFGGPIYNTFETGGYLLWKLNASVKVMVDARSFPYLSWFEDHRRFVSGEDFDAFLHKYPGPQIALIDYAKGPLLRNFARSTQWHLVYIGPSAAIFVRQDSEAQRRIRTEPAPGLATLRNAAGALAIFEFARFAGDYRAAWTVVDRLQSALEVQGRHAGLSGPIAAAGDYRRAHQAARNADHGQAFELLNRSLNGKVISANEQTMLALLRALSREKERPPPDEVPRMKGWLRTLIAPPDEDLSLLQE